MPPTPRLIGLDSTLSESTRRILAEASDDFLAVTAGKGPIHAVIDKNADLPADGGTTFYIGNGYKLTVLKSLSSFGEFNGIAYGPIITFDESFGVGNTNRISNIRVYSPDELRKLMGAP